MAKSSNKSPDADFVIRLVGSNIKPWAVPYRQLNRIVAAVQRLIEQREVLGEEEEENAPERGSDRTISLLAIKNGSAAYQLASRNREATMLALASTRDSVERPESADWTPATLSSVEDISEAAKSLGCVVEFREFVRSHPFGDIIATIKPETYSEISPSAFISGQTSVFARIERVGGATEMHCGIRIPAQNSRMVICRVKSESLVRELGQYIYQEAFLSGLGTWLRHNRMLKRLVISSIEPPKKGSFRDAAKRIHDAGGYVWDKVDDPHALISELRGA